jgi:GNAT superfamily N-acetyltransferase
VTVRIRPARREDLSSLAALGRALNEHQGEPVEHFDAAAILRDGFGKPPRFELLVAENGGEVLGYALFNEAYSTDYAVSGLYLCDLFVAEAARRRGLGRALVGAVAGEARRRGGAFVWWASKPWNTGAHAFYRSLGAIEEAVIAHAIFGAAFDRIAAPARDGEPR